MNSILSHVNLFFKKVFFWPVATNLLFFFHPCRHNL